MPEIRIPGDHRQFATDHAAGFKDRILIQMGAVLDQHNSAVVDFACAMQARLDAAEGLLAQIAACGRRPNFDGTWASVKARTELMNRVDELVAQSKARTA